MWALFFQNPNVESDLTEGWCSPLTSWKKSFVNKSFFQIFVDLTKAVDTANRELLWQILHRLGRPNHFVNVLQSFHDEMKVPVNAGGLLSEPFMVTASLKQVDQVAPPLFTIFFLRFYLKSSHIVRTESIFDITLLVDYLIFDVYQLSWKPFKHWLGPSCMLMIVIWWLIFKRKCQACQAFGLNKTVVMFQLALGQLYIEPSKLQVVDKFTFMDSTINRQYTLDDQKTSWVLWPSLLWPSLLWEIGYGTREVWNWPPRYQFIMHVFLHASCTLAKDGSHTEDTLLPLNASTRTVWDPSWARTGCLIHLTQPSLKEHCLWALKS